MLCKLSMLTDVHNLEYDPHTFPYAIYEKLFFYQKIFLATLFDKEMWLNRTGEIG